MSERVDALLKEKPKNPTWTLFRFVQMQDLTPAEQAEGMAALLARGISVNQPDKHGSTPLMWAALNGHTGVVEALLKVRGIKASHKNQYGDTALSLAKKQGHKLIADMLETTETEARKKGQPSPAAVAALSAGRPR